MSSSITIAKASTVYIENLSSYRMTLQVTAASGIVSTVFVKERHYTIPGTTTDFFVAVATPTQLEDFPTYKPVETIGFFLDSQIDLVARTAEELDNILQEILQEVNKLCTDVDVLNNSLLPTAIYNISNGTVAEQDLASSNHYSVPLISSQGVTISGTLGWSDIDPNDMAGSGYTYVYNTTADLSLSLLFPLSTSLVPFATLLEQGTVRSQGGYKITTSTVYWKALSGTDVPWDLPIGSGSPYYSTNLKLVLSFYK
jgi:hypothetical protein